MDGGDEQGNEPVEGVLVHGVNVGKLSEAEKQHGRVAGDRTISHA